MSYINDKFLLTNKTAEKLYINYAKDMPIFDYHCHLSEVQILKNNTFNDVYEIWLSGDHYKYGDLVIYSGAFYRCIVANSDITFDSTKWSEIGGADSQYDIVEDSSQLPTRFTPADRRMYYSIQDCAFWLWDGYRWSLQERAITDTEIMQLFT